jgi:hypothetical protein
MYAKKNRTRKSETTSPITSPTNMPPNGSVQQTSPTGEENTSSPSLSSSADGFSPENTESLNNSGVRVGSAPAQVQQVPQVQWNVNPTHLSLPTYTENPFYSYSSTYPPPPAMPYASSSSTSQASRTSSIAPPALDEAAIFTPSFLQALDGLYCDPLRALDNNVNDHTQLHLSNEEAKGTG